MAILNTDIKFRLSGGAANAVALAALGGAKSSVDMGTSLLNDVTSAEALAGDIEYRCFYVHNAHATLAMITPKFWLEANTPSPTTTLDVGLGTSALNGTEQTIASVTTAPTGVSFSAATNEAGGIDLGDIPAGQHRAIWVRRTVNAATVAVNETATLRVKCDTAA